MELALSLEKLNFHKLRELHDVADASSDAQMADFVETMLAEQVGWSPSSSCLQATKHCGTTVLHMRCRQASSACMPDNPMPVSCKALLAFRDLLSQCCSDVLAVRLPCGALWTAVTVFLAC